MDQIDFLKTQLINKFKPPAKEVIPNANKYLLSKRLAKDLVEVSKESNAEFELESMDGTLYNWNVKMKQFETESNLAQDLTKLCKEKLLHGLHYIEVRHKNGFWLSWLKIENSIFKNDLVSFLQLCMTFPKDYPMEPPFVRIANPVLRAASVQDSGAILLDFITLDNWKACYTVNLLMLQLQCHLGQAKIDFEAKNDCYTEENAKESYIHIPLLSSLLPFSKRKQIFCK